MDTHENEPGHSLIRHTLRQVVCHENIQQKLQKRVEHVEHSEEVKERDSNAEDMLEANGRHSDENASERIGDEQTGDQLWVSRSELTSFEDVERGALVCVGGTGEIDHG